MNTVNKQIVSQVIPVTILLITVYSVLYFLRPSFAMLAPLNNTTVWWGISSLILVAFFFSKHNFIEKRENRNLLFVWIYLLWNIACIVRGMFVAEVYWDWKGLIGNAMALILPVVAYSATNRLIVQSILLYYIKYVLPLFLVFAVIIRTDAYGFYLIPVSFLLLFLPAVTKRWRYLLLATTAIVLVSDLGARSNVIKFGVPILILGIYYLRNIVSIKFLETIRLLLFIVPIVLFGLGVSGIFNVFDMDSYVQGDFKISGTDMDGSRVEESVTTDTRTFLYEEVLNSAIDNNYWMLGRTPARGNDSNSFGYMGFDLTGRYERLSNEIGLANVFTWTGIIGVILYMIVFFRASYLAVNKSRNIYMKLIGLYIAFRWLFSWIEDVNNFSLNYFMLWIMMGMCYSYSFRDMTNKEVVFWIRGIFDARYIHFQNYLIKKRKYEKSANSRFTNVLQQES